MRKNHFIHMSSGRVSRSDYWKENWNVAVKLTFETIRKLGDLAGFGCGVDGDAVVTIDLAPKVVVLPLGHCRDE